MSFIYKYGKKKKISVLKNILKSLRNGSSIKEACENVHISTQAFYYWRREDKKLEEKVKAIMMEAQNAIEEQRDSDKPALVRKLEDTLMLRACGGFVTKENFKQGKLVSRTYAPPDTAALIFTLTNLEPDRWKNNRDRYGNEPNPQFLGSELIILSPDEQEEQEAKELLSQFENN